MSTFADRRIEQPNWIEHNDGLGRVRRGLLPVLPLRGNFGPPTVPPMHLYGLNQMDTSGMSSAMDAVLSK